MSFHHVRQLGRNWMPAFTPIDASSSFRGECVARYSSANPENPSTLGCHYVMAINCRDTRFGVTWGN